MEVTCSDYIINKCWPRGLQFRANLRPMRGFSFNRILVSRATSLQRLLIGRSIFSKLLIKRRMWLQLMINTTADILDRSVFSNAVHGNLNEWDTGTAWN